MSPRAYGAVYGIGWYHYSMIDLPQNGQFQGKLVKNIGYVVVIVVATVGVVTFFQRPVSAVEDRVGIVEDHVLILETNYANILEKLEDINDKLR